MAVYDNDASLFLVLDDKSIVPGDEIDGNDIERVKFIMLTNELLNSDYDDDNSIFLSRYWKEHVMRMRPGHPKSLNIKQRNIDNEHEKYPFEYTCVKWTPARHAPQGLRPVEKDGCETDVNGQRNTNTFLSGFQTELARYRNEWMESDDSDDSGDYNGGYMGIRDFYPALMAAYDTTYFMAGQRWHGYIPAIGQLAILSANVGAVNDMLRRVCGEKNTLPWRNRKGSWVLIDGTMPNGYHSGWWSSSYAPDEEFFEYNIWSLRDGEIHSSWTKYTALRVLPLFALRF